jgi:hypothetical protein
LFDSTVPQTVRYRVITVLTGTQGVGMRAKFPAELADAGSYVILQGLGFDTSNIYREVWNWSVWDKVLRLMCGCRKREDAGEWREFCRHSIIGTT